MAMLPSGIWHGRKIEFGEGIAWTVQMEFDPLGSVHGREVGGGGDVQIRGSYWPRTACLVKEIQSVVWVLGLVDRRERIEYRANQIYVEDDRDVPWFRRVRFSGRWRHWATSVSGTFELYSVNLVPERIVRPPVSRDWAVSTYNNANYCTVTNVSRDVREGEALSDVSLTFVAIGDGSLGKLQDPTTSILSWGPGHSQRPWHCAFLAECPNLIVGMLFFEAIPAYAEICFAYGRRGYSSTVLREPSVDGIIQPDVSTTDSGESGADGVVTYATQTLEGGIAGSAQLTVEITNKVRELADLQIRLQQLECRGSGDAVFGAKTGGEVPLPDIVEEGLCIACVNAPRNSVFLWCGHQVLCFGCANKMHHRTAVCPVCQKHVSSVQQVFIA